MLLPGKQQTVRNSIKTIKMFCEISDLSLPWKKIGRGLPKGKRYADDRAPTIEEIKTILKYLAADIQQENMSGVRKEWL